MNDFILNQYYSDSRELERTFTFGKFALPIKSLTSFNGIFDDQHK